MKLRGKDMLDCSKFGGIAGKRTLIFGNTAGNGYHATGY